jgi:hypothetical protein
MRSSGDASVEAAAAATADAAEPPPGGDGAASRAPAALPAARAIDMKSDAVSCGAVGARTAPASLDARAFSSCAKSAAPYPPPLGAADGACAMSPSPYPLLLLSSPTFKPPTSPRAFAVRAFDIFAKSALPTRPPPPSRVSSGSCGGGAGSWPYLAPPHPLSKFRRDTGGDGDARAVGRFHDGRIRGDEDCGRDDRGDAGSGGGGGEDRSRDRLADALACSAVRADDGTA